jgi:hypothetical protein
MNGDQLTFTQRKLKAVVILAGVVLVFAATIILSMAISQITTTTTTALSKFTSVHPAEANGLKVSERFVHLVDVMYFLTTTP